MIIALDGNVYTGKTTITEKAKTTGAIVIAEYEPIQKVGDLVTTQRKYLEQEIRRMSLLRHITARRILMDRSVLSLAAHVWALFALNRADIREEFFRCVLRFYRNFDIIIPDFFIHLWVPWALTYHRYIAGESSVTAKGTPIELVTFDYCTAINEFHSLVHQMLGPAISLRITSANLNEAWELINSLMSNTVENSIPDLVVDAIKFGLRLS